MKSLVLHIGIPKTGSSALQVFCAQNRKALLQQSLDYFELGDFDLGVRGKISSGNGAHLARSFLRPKGPSFRSDREEQLAALERRIAASSCEVGFLSSEIFVFADDASIAQFAEWLGQRGITLRFFYLIRDQLQFLTSSYIQQVKRHACTETCEQYVGRIFEKIAHIKYTRLHRRLAKFTTPENILCRSYADARAVEHGVCGLFIEAFGLNAGAFKFADSSVNVSLDLTEIKVMLALNKLKPRMMFSDLMVENAAQRGRKNSDLTTRLLSAATVSRIEDYFAADNAQFAREYFGREQLFEPRRREEATEVDPNSDPPLSEVLEVLGGLLVRFDERLAVLERRISSALATEAEES